MVTRTCMAGTALITDTIIPGCFSMDCYDPKEIVTERPQNRRSDVSCSVVFVCIVHLTSKKARFTSYLLILYM